MERVSRLAPSPYFLIQYYYENLTYGSFPAYNTISVPNSVFPAQKKPPFLSPNKYTTAQKHHFTAFCAILTNRQLFSLWVKNHLLHSCSSSWEWGLHLLRARSPESSLPQKTDCQSSVPPCSCKVRPTAQLPMLTVLSRCAMYRQEHRSYSPTSV